MSGPWPTFWSEPTGKSWCWLRRFTWGTGPGLEPQRPPCKNGGTYHNAQVRIEDGDGDLVNGDVWPHDDPRWPTNCEVCGYAFRDDDEWQRAAWHEYAGGGKTFTLHDAPIGAMWDASWMSVKRWQGPDGICLVVACPGGKDGRALEWMVDAVANNCTKPDDVEHKCWVRKGDPRTGKITVGKDGNTCAAGAGSIQIGNYHGFLTNGELSAG